MIGDPSGCGSTYEKFHSSPSRQSILQKPSLMSHFAIKFFASSLASAKACTIRERHSPIWSMAPFGTLLTVVSLTAANTPPFFRRKRKERSKIDRNALDLWGMAAIGDILSCGGGLSLIASQGTRRAWFVRSFSCISSVKCWIALGVVADQWGPRSTASHISSLVQLRPVRAGQPNVAHSLRKLAAG
jgi:hypothetical protein